MRFLTFCLSLCLTPIAWATCIRTEQLTDYIHVSKIDLNCPNLEFVSSQVEDRGLTVSEFAEKYHTDVAINGSFFRRDLSPIGLNMTHHRPLPQAKDTRARSFLACNAKRQCQIDPLNHLARASPKWQFALAGWHYYDQQSMQFRCAKSDKIGCNQSIFSDKHPRTMVGLNEKQNLLYLVVVEGRQLTFRGMTLDELAQLAQRLELTKAVNLDGGGSTTMVVGNKRISALPFLQGSERKVGNHFGVRLKSNTPHNVSK